MELHENLFWRQATEAGRRVAVIDALPALLLHAGKFHKPIAQFHQIGAHAFQIREVETICVVRSFFKEELAQSAMIGRSPARRVSFTRLAQVAADFRSRLQWASAWRK
ncbi:hypothetical protein [Phyllobacterium sp. K27]